MNRFIGCVLMFVCGIALAQGVMKWVDEDGRVHYGDRPPPGTKVQPVSRGTLSPAASQAKPASTSAPGGDAPNRSGTPARTAVAGSAEALSDYEEGKRRYDAGDDHAALRAFARAAQHEPGNARWHYNLGLTLRQLNQFQAAREAFLAARQRDPEYKRADIDDKLASMGFSASGSGASPTRSSGSRHAGENVPFWEDISFWVFAVPIAFAVIIVVVVIRTIFADRRRARGGHFDASSRVGGSELSFPVDPAKLEAESQRLMRIGALLVSAEHALRLGEDQDLRALLERATELEHGAREPLAAARRGDVRGE